MRAIYSKRLRDTPLFLKPWRWLEMIADIAVAGIAAHWGIAIQDVKYAIRTAVRQPSFTLLVIGTTALGIGAATSIFSIANHVFFRPLPFRQPDRLVRLWRDIRPVGYWRLEISSGVPRLVGDESLI